MSDKEQIEKCIDVYYAGCCESDSDKIKEAFDNNAMISGYLPDGLHEMNLDEFSEFVSAQQNCSMLNHRQNKYIEEKICLKINYL